jgi:hypothetical protein
MSGHCDVAVGCPDADLVFFLEAAQDHQPFNSFAALLPRMLRIIQLHPRRVIYLPLQAAGRTKTFGGTPGEVQPYGFGILDATGSIYTVVNPTQAIKSVDLPLLSRVQPPLENGRVMFLDAGFIPIFRGDTVTLGPGQVASVGFGRYAATEFDLGIQDDVHIPREIEPIESSFTT